MSFASILGPSNNEPPPKAQEIKPAPTTISTTTMPSAIPPPMPVIAFEKKPVAPAPLTGFKRSAARFGYPRVIDSNSLTLEELSQLEWRSKLCEEEIDAVQRALTDIEETSFSDVDDVGFANSKKEWLVRSEKRARDHENIEAGKRKV